MPGKAATFIMPQLMILCLVVLPVNAEAWILNLANYNNYPHNIDQKVPSSDPVVISAHVYNNSGLTVTFTNVDLDYTLPATLPDWLVGDNFLDYYDVQFGSLGDFSLAPFESIDFVHSILTPKVDIPDGLTLWARASLSRTPDGLANNVEHEIFYLKTSNGIVTVVPESSALVMMMMGLAGIGFMRRRKLLGYA